MNSKYIAEDLIEDFDAGLEYAEADCILDVQQKGDSLQYLIRCEILACAAVVAQWSSFVVAFLQMWIFYSSAMVHTLFASRQHVMACHSSRVNAGHGHSRHIPSPPQQLSAPRATAISTSYHHDIHLKQPFQNPHPLALPPALCVHCNNQNPFGRSKHMCCHSILCHVLHEYIALA